MSIDVFCQYSASRHHFFSNSQKTHVVVNKRFALISDSAYTSYEVMTGNINAWNGDIFNQYPSFQFLCSYDNNIDFEIGVFGCIPYSVTNGQNTAGADIFFSYILHDHLFAIFDIYTFMGKSADLLNEMGYQASVYNMYTLRFQYDATGKVSLFTGYSILNDVTKLQHSVFMEADYNVTKNIPLVLGYATELNPVNFSFNNMYGGVGFKSILLDKKAFDIKLVISLNPFTIEKNTAIWPLSILFSVEI